MLRLWYLRSTSDEAPLDGLAGGIHQVGNSRWTLSILAMLRRGKSQFPVWAAPATQCDFYDGRSITAEKSRRRVVDQTGLRPPLGGARILKIFPRSGFLAAALTRPSLSRYEATEHNPRGSKRDRSGGRLSGVGRPNS